MQCSNRILKVTQVFVLLGFASFPSLQTALPLCCAKLKFCTPFLSAGERRRSGAVRSAKVYFYSFCDRHKTASRVRRKTEEHGGPHTGLGVKRFSVSFFLDGCEN